MTAALQELGVTEIDGIVYDLGVSSPQFDEAGRGFSYRFNARLDMRMDQNNPVDAWKVVNEWPYEKLVRIFYRYGEERFSKQIARLIEKRRESQPIDTTDELVEVIKEAIPAAARRHGGHPAKKVFQAIRIAVNDELSALEDSLEQAIDLLAVGGRISVITFQSLEDRLVKTMFREKTSLPELPPNLPIIPEGIKPKYKSITRKPITPSESELEENHRSHSAKLRIIERIKKNKLKEEYIIMAQNNLARDIAEQPKTYVSSPEQVPTEVTVKRVRVASRLQLSAFEKVLIVSGSAILTVLMLLVVSSKIALSNSQHQLQHIDNQIVNVRNDNTNLNQQIGELQSSSRLEKVAKQSNMSLKNANIRNVTK